MIGLIFIRLDNILNSSNGSIVLNCNKNSQSWKNKTFKNSQLIKIYYLEILINFLESCSYNQ